MERNLNCEQMWDLLSVYADEECTPDECAVVERHIAACSACAGHLAMLRQVASILADTEEIAPPPGLREAILAATVHRPSRFRRLRDALSAPSTPVRAMAAATAAAVIGIAVFLSRVPSPISVASAPKATLPSPVPHASEAPAHREPIGKPVRPTLPDERRVALNSVTQSAQARVETTVVQRPVRTRPAPYGIRGGQTITRPSARFAGVTPRLSPPALETPADMPDGGEAGIRDISPMDTTRMAEAGRSPSSEHADGSAESRPLASEGSRVMIANARPPISAGTIASLADLRRALRQKNEAARAAMFAHTLGDSRGVSVDVIRTRF